MTQTNMMIDARCQLCHESAKLFRQIDVPADTVLCERCFPRFTDRCDRCQQIVAEKLLPGGQSLEIAPVDGELWCHRCAAQHAAICESCGANYLAEHLTSAPEGLFCEKCFERLERVKSGRATTLELTHWEEVTICTAQRVSQRVACPIHCLERSEDLIVQILPGAGEDGGPAAQLTVNRTILPPSILWPDEANPNPDCEQTLEKFSEWSVMSIGGTAIGVTLLHFDRAYDVDLEQAIETAILGELNHLGLVSRDPYGRYVDKQGTRI